MKTGNLLKFQINRLFQEMGEITRITFLLLLVILLITMLFIALAPFTIELRISLDHFIIAVIVVGALAVLLPREKKEANAEIELEKGGWWWGFAPAFLIGTGVGLAVYYSIKDIRLSLWIASLSGLFSMTVTLIYRGKTYT